MGRVRSIGLRLFAPGPRVNTPAAGTTASRRLASVIANWPTLASLFAGWRLVFRLAALFVQRGTGCRRAGRRFRVGGSRNVERALWTLDGDSRIFASTIFGRELLPVPDMLDEAVCFEYFISHARVFYLKTRDWSLKERIHDLIEQIYCNIYD